MCDVDKIFKATYCFKINYLPPKAISFWIQLEEATGVFMREPAAGATPVESPTHASSNFCMALLISASVMISGGTNRTTLGPAGTTSTPLAKSAFAT